MKLKNVAQCSSEEFYFDAQEAQRAEYFIEHYCRHVKGQLAGKPLKLAPWQRNLVRNLFGNKRADGTRRYRFVWLESPRKSGKTTLAAAIGLYMLLVDREKAAEIVVAAGTLAQAAICFDIAKAMIQRDPAMSAVCKTGKRLTTYKDSSLRLVSARHRTNYGCNVSCLLFDEVHVQTNRDLHDALITSTGSRSEPLTLYMTMAGCERSSLAWELHEYASKIDRGIINDPAWLVCIFGAEPTDDWTDAAVWRRAHPGIGLTISKEFIEREYRRARATPGFVDTFRRLYLNIWTDSTSHWLDMDKWDLGAQPEIDTEKLSGRECFAGLDLSTITDLSALVLVFKDEDGGYTVLPFAFCPNETIRERSIRDRVDYIGWREQGVLISTEGNTVDHSAIRAKILDLARKFRIQQLAFDRWGSSMLINQLIDDGITCDPISQGAPAMNAPARELERVVAERKLRHGGHPVLRWCVANAVAESNAAGEIKPSKSRSTERIDLLVAMLMALSRFRTATWPALVKPPTDRGRSSADDRKAVAKRSR